MAIPYPDLRFGNAGAWYPNGVPRTYAYTGSLRRRPEDTGADVVRFGRTPRPWTHRAVLLATTLSGAYNQLARWDAEQWQVRTLYRNDLPFSDGSGVCLQNVAVIWGPKRVYSASDWATNWITSLQLTFMRVSETTP